MPNDDLMALRDEVLSEYPAMRSTEFELMRGDGQGFAEVFPVGETKDHPMPGKNVIQLRPKSQIFTKDETKRLIGGEVLHFMGGMNDDGKPNNQEFRKFKDEFVKSLTPEQLDFERYFHNKLTRQGHENRPFDKFMEVSRVDEYMRGYLFPDRNAEFLEEGVLTPKQKRLLERARKFLKGGSE